MWLLYRFCVWSDVFEYVVNLLHVLYSSYKNVCSIAVDRVLSANLGDAREVMLC